MYICVCVYVCVLGVSMCVLFLCVLFVFSQSERGKKKKKLFCQFCHDKYKFSRCINRTYSWKKKTLVTCAK